MSSSQEPSFAEESNGNEKILDDYQLVDSAGNVLEEAQYLVRYTTEYPDQPATSSSQPIVSNSSQSNQYNESTGDFNQSRPPESSNPPGTSWGGVRTIFPPSAPNAPNSSRVFPIYQGKPPTAEQRTQVNRVIKNAVYPNYTDTPILKPQTRPRPILPKPIVDKNAINHLHKLLPQLVPAEPDQAFYEPTDIDALSPVTDDDGFPEIAWYMIDNFSGQFPIFRHNHQAVNLKDYMVVFGGTSNGANNMLNVYNPDANMWVGVQVAGECPRGVSGFAMACYKSNLFIYGGILNNGRCHGEFYELNTCTFEWAHLAVRPNARNEFPRTRTGHTLSISKDGYCYIFGGVYTQDNGPDNIIQHHMSDIFMINLHLPELHYEYPQTFGPRPPARESHAATLFERGSERKLIISGGVAQTRLNDLWMLDLNSMTWTNLLTNEIPRFPRSHHSISAVGNSLYIFGGWITVKDEDQLVCKATNSLEVFHLKEKKWGSVKSCFAEGAESYNRNPFPRTMHSMTCIKNRLYLFSGRDGYDKVSCDMWQLDVSRPPPPPRVELVRSGTTALAVHWDQILTATSYLLQIQKVGPVTLGCVVSSPEKKVYSSSVNVNTDYDDSIIVEAKPVVKLEASYSNPESLTTEDTVPHDILADCSSEPSTASSSSSTSEEEKQDCWYDVGIIEKNSIRVTHHFLSTRFTEDGKHVSIKPGRVDLSLIRKAEIEPGTAYRFRVASVNTCGRGVWSEVSAFKTCLPGLPGSPTDVRINKVIGGAHLTWEPPLHCPGDITEYTVHLAVKSSTSNVKEAIVFIRVYVGPESRCTVTSQNLSMAHIDNEHGPKPAVLFRITARNDRGYGPATQIRWVQSSQARVRLQGIRNETGFPKPYYSSSKRLRMDF